jgi:hypothetical protein
MLKKLLFLFIAFTSLFADEYPSIHEGSFLSSNAIPMLTTTTTYQSASITIDKHSAQSSTGTPYFPQGWNKFKFYVPAGSLVTLSLSTKPNSVLRFHYKFSERPSNTIDHLSPLYGLIDTTGASTKLKFISNAGAADADNSTSSQGGWVYADVVEDSANSYSENGYISSTKLNITYKVTKYNHDLYAAWFQDAFFINNGDPSALESTMNIVNVSTPNTPSYTNISLDYGGAKYDGTLNSSASSNATSSASSGQTSSTQSSATSSTASSASSNPCPSGYIFSNGTCISTNSSSSTASQTSSTASSASSNPCPSGYIFSNGTCISTNSSSSTASQTSSLASSVSNCIDGTVPSGPGSSGVLCSSSSTASQTSSTSSASSNPCPSGYIFSNGTCVVSSSSSSSSSVSSTSKTDVSITLQPGWNLISLPISTKESVDINATFYENATIGWKFKFISDANESYEWTRWLHSEGNSFSWSNTQGIFIGIPTNYSPQTITLSLTEDINATRFESLTLLPKKWYFLGFGYELSTNEIKTLYPNSILFEWSNTENKYKKLDVNNSIKAGQGFVFYNNTI